MNTNFIERKLLSDEDIFTIRKLIDLCEWQDGIKTTDGKSLPNIKKNLEVIHSDLKCEIDAIIMKALDKDQKFITFCVPKNSSNCIVSKTPKGGYYNPHVDSYDCGHFSTTVFISDPSEYEGGELCLYLDGQEKKIKPKSGTAITYKTGIMHRVNPVSSGERLVCVLWTNSAIRDDNIRDIFCNLTNVLSIMEKNDIKSKDHKNFDHISEDPIFILANLREQILRNYFV